MSVELTETQQKYLDVVLELYKEKEVLRIIDVAKYMDKPRGSVWCAIKVLSEKGILKTDSKGVITLVK